MEALATVIQHVFSEVSFSFNLLQQSLVVGAGLFFLAASNDAHVGVTFQTRRCGRLLRTICLGYDVETEI